MSILVVGSVALDTIKSPAGYVEQALGGSALYFAAAASFFTEVRIVAVAGTDFPFDRLDFLKKRHVDFQGLEKVEGKTFHWSGEYTLDWNNAKTHDTQLNVFENFSPVIPPAYRKTEVLFLGNIHPVLQMKVLQQMDKPKIVALDTMNFWINGQRDALMEVLKQVDVLLVNDGETKLLTHESDLIRGAMKVFKMGPKAIVLKKGEHGVILSNQGDLFVLPAYPISDICDPTGAGDTFAGGFLGYLDQNKQFDKAAYRKAVVYGSVIASYTVTDFSFNRLISLTQDDINKRYQQFVELTRFW